VIKWIRFKRSWVDHFHWSTGSVSSWRSHLWYYYHCNCEKAY